MAWKATDAMSHYFDEHPAAPSEQQRIEVVLADVAFVLHTDRGVFSHGRLDTGTGLLLRTAPEPHGHELLDLGCGAGAIALTMASRRPDATVWAVDVNARARELCAANAARNDLTNVRVVAPDELPPGVRLSTIWSNPPIRIGKPALHELLSRWLARLAPGGAAALVVHKHLGSDSLQQWLVDGGHTVARLASKSGYRVLWITAAAAT